MKKIPHYLYMKWVSLSDKSGLSERTHIIGCLSVLLEVVGSLARCSVFRPILM